MCPAMQACWCEYEHTIAFGAYPYALLVVFFYAVYGRIAYLFRFSAYASVLPQICNISVLLVFKYDISCFITAPQSSVHVVIQGFCLVIAVIVVMNKQFFMECDTSRLMLSEQPEVAITVCQKLFQIFHLRRLLSVIFIKL